MNIDEMNEKLKDALCKIDKIYDYVIRHDEKIKVIWAFLFSGITLTALLTLFLKFIL